MQYQITHTTHYTYSHPVHLGPHQLRLCPRQDGAQWLRSFHLNISAPSAQQTYLLDINGNTCIGLTVDQPLSELTIQSQSEVHTTRSNPFDYLSEPWAVELPIDYPSALAAQLAPYLATPPGVPQTDPVVIQLAQSIAAKVSGNIGLFLTQLTQYIPDLCDYQQRLEGAPHAPGITLQKKAGTCRDFAVLFMALCQAMGLAARFVSGYQEGDAQAQATHDLHAWAEVYIPGGGWRGFDPTLGLAVADRHIAIAAAPFPYQAAPITGLIKKNPAHPSSVSTDLTTNISLRILNP